MSQVDGKAMESTESRVAQRDGCSRQEGRGRHAGHDRQVELKIPQIALRALEGSTPSLAADRLYQFAAVTAGIFLLVTLL